MSILESTKVFVGLAPKKVPALPLIQYAHQALNPRGDEAVHPQGKDAVFPKGRNAVYPQHS